MDSQASSFRVQLSSLQEFAGELREKLELGRTCAVAMADLAGKPELPLGAFAEAFSFSDAHSDTVRDMGVLLGRIQAAIGFAANVTTVVAARYEGLGAAGVAAMGAVGAMGAVAAPGYSGTATPPPGTLVPSVERTTFTVPIPTEGTVYYHNESGGLPVQVTVQTRDA